jgi:hypothetical protein
MSFLSRQFLNYIEHELTFGVEEFDSEREFSGSSVKKRYVFDVDVPIGVEKIYRGNRHDNLGENLNVFDPKIFIYGTNFFH